MEEELADLIITTLFLFIVILPREEYYEYICIPFVSENLIGVKVCNHEW